MSEKEKKLGLFDKLLPIWIALCIVFGIFLSQIVPGISEAINALQIGGISIPIGICLLGIFVGLPLILGLISKKALVKSKGVDWFHNKYRPAVSTIGVVALLMTLIVLFSLNGQVLLDNPNLLLLITVPLLVGFAIVVGYNILVTKVLKMKYPVMLSLVYLGRYLGRRGFWKGYQETNSKYK